MSAIAGMVTLDRRPVDAGVIARMLDHLKHRGPDRVGTWVHGHVGLGHRALWSTPESLQEQLPLQSEDGNLTITADARIDNRDELIEAILASGHSMPRTSGDGELILRAYQTWGDACPSRIVGDFAFVIWDARRNRLFAACDPIGIRPLYYRFDGLSFRWASEPRAIFEDPSLRMEPNLRLFGLFLVSRFAQPEETVYKDVWHLPVGESLVLEGGRLVKTKYWDIAATPAIRYRNEGDYSEHFLSLFRQAVESRLRTNGATAVWLSGGLDSSSIACVAQSLIDESAVPSGGLETFSMVFDEMPCDERPYISDTIEMWKIRANLLRHEQLDKGFYPELASLHPDGFSCPSSSLLVPTLEMVRSKGIRVMLTGLGGDDLLSSGYGHLADLFMRGRWIRLRRQVEADARAMSSTARATFIRYALLPLIGGFPRAFLKEMRDRMHGPQFPRWIDAEFLSRLGVLESMKRADRVSRPGSHAQQDIYRAVLSGSLRNLSLIYLDQTCYSFQVEHRHPFLDRRIIEYLWAIPPEQRRRYDVTKVVLRAAMKGILPESIRLRSGKTSFQPVYERQIRNHRPPQEMLEDSYLVSVGAVRPEGMKHLLASFQKAGIESDRMWEIYRFVWMESWSRQIAREAVVPETVRC